MLEYVSDGTLAGGTPFRSSGGFQTCLHVGTPGALLVHGLDPREQRSRVCGWGPSSCTSRSTSRCSDMQAAFPIHSLTLQRKLLPRSAFQIILLRLLGQVLPCIPHPSQSPNTPVPPEVASGPSASSPCPQLHTHTSPSWANLVLLWRACPQGVPISFLTSLLLTTARTTTPH